MRKHSKVESSLSHIGGGHSKQTSVDSIESTSTKTLNTESQGYDSVNHSSRNNILSIESHSQNTDSTNPIHHSSPADENQADSKSHHSPPLYEVSHTHEATKRYAYPLSQEQNTESTLTESSKDSINQRKLFCKHLRSIFIKSKAILCVLKHRIFPSHNALTPTLYATYRDISIFALCNIFFLICVFTPFAVYSSDVSQFDASRALSTLCALFGVFLLLIFVSVYVTSFFYRTRLLVLGAFSVSVILCIGVVYTFVLDFNVISGESYSQMDNFVFKNPHTIAHRYNKYIDVCVGLCAMVAIALAFIYKNAFLIALKAIFIGLFVVWIYTCIHIYQYLHTEKEQILSSQTLINSNDLGDYTKLLPPFHKALATFSKNEQNVIVLLFDGFTGSHLRVIFEQFPELKDAFNGFTYYPNTLSLDGHTTRTAHTILTGHSLSAFANKDVSMQTYHNRVTQALIESYQNFHEQGFEVLSFGMPHIHNTDSMPHIDIYEDTESYLNAYAHFTDMQDLITELRKHNMPIGEMLSIGLFYFAPYTLRLRIYKDFEFGNYSWIFGAKQQIGSFINGIKNASALPMIVRNLHVSESAQKSFKYIHTMHTHYPFALNANTCLPEFTALSMLPEKYKSFVANARHYDNEICAIKESIILLDFLKKHHIYDNSMIVLVSDHSYNDIIEHNMPYQHSLGNNPNPLLMIKPFNANSTLKEDMRLMSNADVYGILCNTLNACEETNILNAYPHTRELIHTLNVHWTQQARDANVLLFDKIWLIQGNVLQKEHFIDITDSVKNLSK